MTILNFKVDLKKIDSSLETLSNSMRLELYENYNDIFNLLNYEDDNIFLEPSLLFSIFATANNTVSIGLNQILWGHIDNTLKPVEIDVTTDGDGKIHLPNFGYFNFLPDTKLQFRYTQEGGHELFNCNNEKIHPIKLINNIYLSNSGIKLCLHKNDILKNIYSASFNEPVEETLKKHKPIIDIAWSKLEKVCPDFCSLIQKTTREIFLFDCQNQNSFASMSYFGAALINVNNQEANEIFFIDDISHQCGHIIFYALTLDRQAYFLDSPDSILSSYTGLQDARTVYDLFHGLFTYTSTLDSLSKCYESEYFSQAQKVEILGRIGFYMQKFTIDIEFMNNPKILSKSGEAVYLMFVKSYSNIHSKYSGIIKRFKFTSQPYFYNHSLFLYENVWILTS